MVVICCCFRNGLMSGGLVYVVERKLEMEVDWRGWPLKPFELNDFAKKIKIFSKI